MFRAGLLLIIRKITSAQTADGTAMRYVDWLLSTVVYRQLILLMSSKPVRNMYRLNTEMD
jgi:hypothetical protein